MINDRVCYECESNTTRIDKLGRVTWRNVKDKGWYCNKCFMKHYTNKNRNPITQRKWYEHSRKRKINFLKRRMYLTWDIRKYVCSWCNIKSNLTDMHHLYYLPCMPWAGMVELCRKCHQNTKRVRLESAGF